MVNANRAIVREQSAALEVNGVRIGAWMVGAPGEALGKDRIVQRHDRIVWGHNILIIDSVKVPANLELFEVAEAADGSGLIFGSA